MARREESQDVVQRDEAMERRIPRVWEFARNGLTLRVMILGVLCIVMMSWIYYDIQYKIPFGIGFAMYRPVFYDVYAPNIHSLLPVVSIILIVNPILRLFNKRLQFKKEELITLNILTLFGGLLQGLGLWVWYFIPVTGLAFPVLNEPWNWAESAAELNKSFAFMTDEELIRDFWSGGISVPWGAWIVPILFWILFFGVFCFVMMCFAAIVRKRWTEFEHLTFPITRVKMAYIDGRAYPNEEPQSLWSNKLLWVGVLLACLYGIPQAINTYYPGFPALLATELYTFRQNVFKGNELFWICSYRSQLSVSLITMSVMWFMRLDILFSIWFFEIFRWITNMLFIQWNIFGFMRATGGVGGTVTRAQEAEVAGFIGLGLFFLWMARGTFAEAFRRAFIGGKHDEGEDCQPEPLSDRVAVFGLIGGFVFLVVAASLALKIRIIWSFIFFLMMIMMTFSLSRIRSEAGLGFQFPGQNYPVSRLLPVFGTKLIGRENAPGLGFLENIGVIRITSFQAAFLETWKMGDEGGLNRKTVTFVSGLSIVLGLFLFWIVILPYTYKVGVSSIYFQVKGRDFGPWTGLINKFRTGVSVDVTIITWYLYIAVSTIVLGLLSTKFVSWPFHPIGYVVGTGWCGLWFIEMAFAVWLVKFFTMRYGGYKVFQKITPVFLGLGVGQLVNAVFTLGLIGLKLLRVI